MSITPPVISAFDLYFVPKTLPTFTPAMDMMHKGDGAAALLGRMVVPFVAPNGDAVVAGHTILRPGADELLALPPQELHQIHTAGTIFLFLGEMDIGHIVGHLPRFSRFG